MLFALCRPTGVTYPVAPLACDPMRTLLLVCLLAVPAAAQTPGACALGTAQGDLATPDLLARVFNTGNLFYGNATNGDGYVVPRATGRSPLYFAALMVAGQVSGEVRAAAGNYSFPTFWPGPLDEGATLPNAADCSAWDRIYVVSPADVAMYEATGVATPDLAGWPVGLGARAVDAGGQPVVGVSRDQVVDLAAGERPVLYGGPTAFWVMNDVGGSRTFVTTPPLGIEVRVTAFAVDVSTGERPVALRQATAYRYEIVNRNAQPLRDLHVGFYADPDLGLHVDDYVGVDTTRELAFAYNADNDDQEPVGYGAPPAFGMTLLNRPLWTSSYMTGFGPGTGEAHTGDEYFNRLSGLWNDGLPIRAYGSGYQQTQGDVTRFTFTGDPVSGAFWSERNTDGSGTASIPSDRRFVLSAPAVTLAPGASTTVDFALVFGWGSDHLHSVTALRHTTDAVQVLYDDGFLFGPPPPVAALAAPALVAPADGAEVGEADVLLSWEPVAGAQRYVVEVSRAPDFRDAEVLVADGTEFLIPAERLPVNQIRPLFWCVRAAVDGREGTPSAVRSFRGGRYVPGALRLFSGAFAFVETTAPGGAPACDGPADPDEGCSEVNGDLVASSLNSTSDYVLVADGATSLALGALGSRDLEMRFTETGSIAYTGIGGASQRLFRVPFEVWDVGVVAPGGANDPSDDRQLVVRLTDLPPPDASLCAFEYTNPTVEGYGLTTRSFQAYYTVGDDYAAYAAAAEAAVAAAPDGCAVGSGATGAAYAFVDRDRPIPLQSVRLEQAGTRTTGDLTGTTIRFYTADPFVDGEAAPAEATLALAPPRPNPAAGRVALPYRLADTGAVRLTVVDALGRTVATLADGVRAAGEHMAEFDARRLAPGVYAVVLDADGRRAVRRLTIAR